MSPLLLRTPPYGELPISQKHERHAASWTTAKWYFLPLPLAEVPQKIIVQSLSAQYPRSCTCTASWEVVTSSLY